MEAKDKEYIRQEILRKFPGTDPEDIDWEMIEIAFEAGVRVTLRRIDLERQERPW